MWCLAVHVPRGMTCGGRLISFTIFLIGTFLNWITKSTDWIAEKNTSAQHVFKSDEKSGKQEREVTVNEMHLRLLCGQHGT